MLNEKFIKVNDRVYYESELKLMSSKQLKGLIDGCQAGIEQIENKKIDYKKTNTEEINSDRFWDTIRRFEATQVYLQSDIILISKILKTREPENDPLLWYEKFYDIAMANLPSWKKKRFIETANTEAGFSLTV